MLNKIKFLFMNFKYNLKKELKNRVGFVFKVFVCILNDASFFALWKTFFSLQINIGNANFNTIMIIGAMAYAVHGASHVFFENIYYLPQIISSHNLDFYMTKPQNILYSVSVSKIQVESFGDLIYGFLLFFTFGKLHLLPLFIMLVIFGAISTTAFNAIIGSFAFWIKNAATIAYNAYFTLTCSSTYPEGIFKGFAKFLLLFIIPSALICHFPVSIISNFNLKILSIIVLFTFLICIFANIIFKLGLKKYSS